MTKHTRRVVTAAVMLGTALAALDATVVSAAMPTIVGHLGMLSLYPWVFSAYLLASTITIPIYGKLADLYGRKRIFTISAILFLVGSGLCGAATSMPELILFRVVQGVGAGGVQPMTFTIVGDIYQEPRKTPVFRHGDISGFAAPLDAIQLQVVYCKHAERGLSFQPQPVLFLQVPCRLVPKVPAQSADTAR